MTDDQTLDQVIALWKQADEHSDKAEFLLTESENQQHMANQLEDQAEELWKPLAEAHPEWFDALHIGEDPRRVPTDE